MDLTGGKPFTTGKTFTMLGPEKVRDRSTQGVMPQALDHLFSSLKNSADIETYSVRVSYVEVYMDEILNLLAASSSAKAKDSDKIKEGDKIKVSVDTKGVVSLTPVPLVPVDSCEAAMELVEFAQGARKVAAHNLNDRSSRSHTVLTVWVQTTRKGGASFLAKLNLVDLAGSERSAATGATGQTAKEGVKINGSLLQLQLVVQALATKGGVPSFRCAPFTNVV